MTIDRLPARRRLPPAQRRSLILAAAAEVFGERGYAAGSVDAIGARMGISGAAIYRRFARKQNILIALLDEAVTRALVDLDAGERAADDPKIRLKQIVQQMVKHTAAERTTLRLIHSEIVDLDEADRAQVKAIGERLMEPVTVAMRAMRPTLVREAAVLQVRACFAVLGGFATTTPSAFDSDLQSVTARVLLAILEA